MVDQRIIKILDEINKAMAIENKLNCHDTGVFGGFSKFLIQQGEALVDLLPPAFDELLDQFQETIHQYAEASQNQRRDLLRIFSRHLEVFLTGIEKGPQFISQVSSNLPLKKEINWEKPFKVTKVIAGEVYKSSTVTSPSTSLFNESTSTPEYSEPQEIKLNKEGSHIKEVSVKKEVSTTQVKSKLKDPTPNSNLTDKGLQYLPGVGPKRVSLLNRLGIFTIRDLLYYFPKRYEDRSNLKKIKQLVNGEVETICGRIKAVQEIRPRKGLLILKAAIDDGTGIFYAVWFNQSFLKKQLKLDTEIIVSGKVEKKFGAVQIGVTEFELVDGDETTHTGRIVPIYPVTEGINNRLLRSIIKTVIDNGEAFEVAEFLPQDLLTKYRLPHLQDALIQVHFPEEFKSLEKARKRLIYEELLLLQLGIMMLKHTQKVDAEGIAHLAKEILIEEFLKILPFKLTNAQQEAWLDIKEDMEDKMPMNRLIQGDVGSGKTVIATMALLKTIANGYQGALMAPTEILAEQHYLGIKELLEPLNINVGLLKGSLSKKNKEQYQADISEGKIDLVIGTHALIQEGVEFKKLGLAVIDEQHRFGVKQRAQLKQKGYNPDILVMTATPIPRTLALTLYGDLDLSVINELPPGRKPIKTYWVTKDIEGRIYKFIGEQLSEGRQAYVVCPLIEESEKMDLLAATDLAESWQHEVFPQYKIGLIHGKMKTAEKEAIMERFRMGEIQILVSTTVIEVGVNVPNSTIMVIQDAERFGLAQLHQLRGRVGRGSHQSYCLLIANPKSDEGKARMKIMQSTNDGFIIAEEDLQIRGPGEFFGTRQAGLPDLKIANILRDVKVMEIARQDAQEIIEEDAKLQKEKFKGLRVQLKAKFKLGQLNIEIV